MEIRLCNVLVADKGSVFYDEPADIAIADGIIRSFAAAASPSDGFSLVIDGENIALPAPATRSAVYVSPGWVDVFADYREPGLEHKETIETGLNAAAAGGFTDVFIVPGTIPAIANAAIVAQVLQRAAGHAVSMHVTGAISRDTEGNALAEMLEMRDAGAIAFTDGWKPVQSAGLLLKALEYVKSFDGVVIQIPSDAALTAGGLMHEGGLSTLYGMQGIPYIAETTLLYRDIALAGYTGSRLHATGITTEESVELIRKAKKDGIRVTCSVTPYHLALTDEALQHYESVYKVTPPLRPEASRKALISGVADGTIDCIASHHRPHEWDAKEKEFDLAAEGMAIQQIAFSVACRQIGGSMDAAQLADVFGTRAREIFGLPAAKIAEGQPAVMTVFDTETIWTPVPAAMQSKGVNNPFVGKELTGKVYGIINNGKIVLNQ